MRQFIVTSFAAALLAGAGVLQAQEAPPTAAPEKEHVWLQQFVGEWESESEAILEPGMPPLKCSGTESARAVGGFWIVAENKGMIMDQPMTGILTIGYDPQKKKYVGTWIDSMNNYLWKYEGTVDAAGKILTLEAEGPNPFAPGKRAKFKDATEFKSKDHKVLTSSILGEDGKWTTFMTSNYRRKK